MGNVTRTPPKNVTVQTAILDTSTSGANVLVAAPGSNQAIRVLSIVVVAAAANTIKLFSTTTTSNKTALYALAANGGLVCSFNEHGWFQTTNGEGLSINLSAATAVGITIQYIVL
jgi:hypothetical protein